MSSSDALYTPTADGELSAIWRNCPENLNPMMDLPSFLFKRGPDKLALSKLYPYASVSSDVSTSKPAE